MSAGNGNTASPPPEPRRTWTYSERAKEFHASRGYSRYTMDFNATLEAEMVDEGLHATHRVLACVKRYAWGNLCDYAVDALPPQGTEDRKPTPLTQVHVAERTKLSEATVSETCAKLRALGYLRDKGALLWPEDQINGPLFKQAAPRESRDRRRERLECNSDSPNSPSPFLRYQEGYFREHPEVAKQLVYHVEERERYDGLAAIERASIKKIKDQIFGSWRDEERRRIKSERPASSDSPNGTAAGVWSPPSTPVESGSDATPEGASVASDSTNENFGLHEEKVRTPPDEIRGVRTSEAPNPFAVNENGERPLNALISEGEKREASSSFMGGGPGEGREETAGERPSSSQPTTHSKVIGGISSTIVVPQPSNPVVDAKTEHAIVAGALKAYAGNVDPLAAKQLISNCRKNAPDATAVEIAHFVHEKGKLVIERAKRGNAVANAVGFLLTSVPSCLAGDALATARAEIAAHAEELRQQEQRSAGDKLESDVRYALNILDPQHPQDLPPLEQQDLEHARSILQAAIANPAVAPDQRERARAVLDLPTKNPGRSPSGGPNENA